MHRIHPYFYLFLAGPLLAGTPASAVAQQDTALTAALTANRHTLQHSTDGTLTGAGATLLIDAGRDALFFGIAEEHGVAEIPQLAASLFRALAPAGYRHLAIETGRTLASRLNQLVLERDPEQAVTRFATEHFPGAPFYTLREEAALLAVAAAAAGRRRDVLWGIDYDILGDRYALRRLRQLAPNPAARAAADRAIAVADSMLRAALEKQNLGGGFMFVGPDSTIAALRRAYAPAPGSEAGEIIALLEETRRINGLFFTGRNYESNVARADLLRSQFVRHWQRATRDAAPSAARRTTRVMVKLGANHLLRGRNFTNTFDVGSLLPELAASHGGRAFSVMVVGGRGTRNAVIDRRNFGYTSATASFGEAEWAKALFDAADTTRWTLYDLRALRPLAHAGRLGTLPPRLTQVIFGFDAFVILSGSTPAEALVKR